MNTSRIKSIAKLILLFGAPLSVVIGLFSWGVHFGFTHRATLFAFERDWLGMDPPVVDAQPGREEASSEVSAPAEKLAEVRQGPAKTSSDTDAAAQTKSDTNAKADGRAQAAQQAAQAKAEADRATAQRAAAEPAAVERTTEVERSKPDHKDGSGLDSPPQPAPSVPMPSGAVGVEAKADPVGGELAAKLAVPLTVSVKVLVDDRVIESERNWIDYVQRTVGQSSAVFKKQFGIELVLVSVGRWDVAADGMDGRLLLSNLTSHPREGADVIVGLSGRALDEETLVRADGPDTGSDLTQYNRAYGVAFASAGHKRPHLRTFLREVGYMLGAVDLTDPGQYGYKAGSWMVAAPVTETSAPWIDAENRERVLRRKGLRFAPEPRSGERE